MTEWFTTRLGEALAQKRWLSSLRAIVQSFIAFSAGLCILCIGLVIVIITIVAIVTDLLSQTAFHLDPYNLVVSVGAFLLGLLFLTTGVRYVRFAVGKGPQP